MVDLVGTCPQGFFREWIEEGDAAGEPATGEEWGWYTGHSFIQRIEVGERFYVVAHRRLRGYAIVTGFVLNAAGRRVAICRREGAIPVTLLDPVPGFRGLRKRWWSYEDEIPFPDWKTP